MFRIHILFFLPFATAWRGRSQYDLSNLFDNKMCYWQFQPEFINELFTRAGVPHVISGISFDIPQQPKKRSMIRRIFSSKPAAPYPGIHFYIKTTTSAGVLLPRAEMYCPKYIMRRIAWIVYGGRDWSASLDVQKAVATYFDLPHDETKEYRTMVARLMEWEFQLDTNKISLGNKTVGHLKVLLDLKKVMEDFIAHSKECKKRKIGCDVKFLPILPTDQKIGLFEGEPPVSNIYLKNPIKLHLLKIAADVLSKAGEAMDLKSCKR